MEDPIYTVRQVTQALQELLEEAVPPLWVEGEVSNFRASQAGHWYFTLTDAQAQLPVVMWRLAAMRNQHVRPEDGALIRARGELTVYQQGGNYQLQAERVLPVGTGAVVSALEHLREALRKEGLFSEKRKKPLPAFPSVVGVVTSPRGAAVQDILAVIGERYPIAQIVLYPIVVQGANAPPEIVHALRMLNLLDAADVIVIGRGGGSSEDLSAFNEEAVVRAVAESRLPVVSAVGHETDITLTDLAADARAATPSAAAEHVVPDKEALLNELSVCAGRLAKAMNRRIESSRQKLAELKRAVSPKRQRDALQNRMQRVDELAWRLEAAVKAQALQKQNRLQALAGTLNALSPLAVLERGYSVCYDENGTPIRSAETVTPGDPLRIQLRRGEILANATAVRKDEDDGE